MWSGNQKHRLGGLYEDHFLVADICHVPCVGKLRNRPGREKVKVEPITPPEAKLLAMKMMDFATDRDHTDLKTLEAIKTIMHDAKGVLLLALKENPEELNAARSTFLESRNTPYAEIANTVLEILVLRLRPLIDQGKTDLAASYIKHVIEGAILAIDHKLKAVA